MRRVLGRYFSLALDTKDAVYSGLAESLLPTGDVARFNWALFNLGALVSAAKNSRCTVCPLSDGCLSSLKGASETITTK